MYSSDAFASGGKSDGANDDNVSKNYNNHYRRPRNEPNQFPQQQPAYYSTQQNYYNRGQKKTKWVNRKNVIDLKKSSSVLPARAPRPDPPSSWANYKVPNSCDDKNNKNSNRTNYQKKQFYKKNNNPCTNRLNNLWNQDLSNSYCVDPTKSSILSCAIAESKIVSEENAIVPIKPKIILKKSSSSTEEKKNNLFNCNIKNDYVNNTNEVQIDPFEKVISTHIEPNVLQNTVEKMSALSVADAPFENDHESTNTSQESLEDDRPHPLAYMGTMNKFPYKGHRFVYTNNNACQQNPNKRDLLSHLTAKDFEFDRYARYSQQACQIKDYVRTITYQNAIEQNAHYLQGSVVMVLRAGLGLLAMMCARHGRARKIIALETSYCAEYTKKIIEDNGFADVITVINKRPSQIKSLRQFGVQQLDVIVSDWMGDAVFGNGDQLEDLIMARDLFLKPGGLLIPENVQLYAQAHDSRRHYEHNCTFWDDVYGFDMSSMKKLNLTRSDKEKERPKGKNRKTKNGKQVYPNWKEPLVTFLNPYKVVSKACLLYEWDLRTCSLIDARCVHDRPMNLLFTRTDYCHLIELFFVARFPYLLSEDGCPTTDTAHRQTYDLESTIGFSTSSASPNTSYMQCGLLLDQPLLVFKGDTFRGRLCVWREQNQTAESAATKPPGKQDTCKCCDNAIACPDLNNDPLHLRDEYLNFSLKYSFKNKYTSVNANVCRFKLRRHAF
ncbi:uncharacterized protein LOC126841519 [Adelges cooleyi]|uniref:uncharacterized protein LOC126841519 n=1 Tax=Adelges cooleyi TaxID=133065 RepID=UPI0021806D51|nr:uncharacterized protein LOC126841519 [Adelges cooleyi]